MSKRYDEAIEVRADGRGDGAPVAFTWRERRYDVDQHLGSWREAGEWWNGDGRRDREYFRVAAHPAGTLATGDLDPDGFWCSVGAVYDIYRDRAAGGWRLVRIWD